MEVIAEWLYMLEHTSWSVAIRQSTWLYPCLEIIHIVGIVLLVGPAFMFDLRLLGFSKHLSVKALERHLLPWSLRGSLLVVPSGFLLFITNAGTLGFDPVFWTKMSLLLLAASNGLIFHRVICRSSDGVNISFPTAAKAVAVLSLILWVAVIACGRLLAY